MEILNGKLPLIFSVASWKLYSK